MDRRAYTSLMQLIHRHENIYDGFVPMDKDLQGWGGHPFFFEDMINITCPKLIVEVGTWKGKSACAIATYLKYLKEYFQSGMWGPSGQWTMDSKVICVDTWLGATEFVGAASGSKRDLLPKFGYPQIYYQFLSNVIHKGLQEQIIPFPQTSTNAARFLRKAGVKADLIFIDGSHEYEDVLSDLYAWNEVLSKDGIMFGDDYCQYWSGVIDAVNQFAEAHNLVVDVKSYDNPNGEPPSDYWILSKDGVDF